MATPKIENGFLIECISMGFGLIAKGHDSSGLQQESAFKSRTYEYEAGSTAFGVSFNIIASLLAGNDGVMHDHVSLCMR